MTGRKKYMLVFLSLLLVKVSFAQEINSTSPEPLDAVQEETSLPQESASEPDPETKTFKIDNPELDVEELSDRIGKILTPDLGKVKLNKRKNILTVTDIASKLEEVGVLVSSFEGKKKQVFMEGKIVQIILSDEYKTGVDWEAILSDFQTLPVTSTLGPNGPTPKDGKISIGTLTADDFAVLLEALDTVGTTNILSNPKVNAFNREETKILVGSSEPVLTTTTTTPSDGPRKVDQDLNLMDSGVQVFVTPLINDDGLIMLTIKPELSSPLAEPPEAKTTVIIKSGSTIVIGGLIKDEKLDTINKIPILGDIPFVGFVFRNENQKIRKTELVLFLTPIIQNSDGDKKIIQDKMKKDSDADRD